MINELLLIVAFVANDLLSRNVIFLGGWVGQRHLAADSGTITCSDLSRHAWALD